MRKLFCAHSQYLVDNGSMWFSLDPDVIGGHHPHADERKILLKRYLYPSLNHRSFPSFSYSIDLIPLISHLILVSLSVEMSGEREGGSHSVIEKGRERSLRERGKETPWVPIQSHDFNTCFLPKSIEFRKRKNREGKKRRKERGSYHNNELMRTFGSVLFRTFSDITDK